MANAASLQASWAAMCMCLNRLTLSAYNIAWKGALRGCVAAHAQSCLSLVNAASSMTSASI